MAFAYHVLHEFWVVFMELLIMLNLFFTLFNLNSSIFLLFGKSLSGPRDDNGSL